eukprot:CAMPEP_0113884238 /NCGR_PEP_ID=MMETSP0780_2-20120614/10134_1 /TAXON_ID=652834 /ORGANISM="Palpitomonas bilix" /LENGTH=1058 /DNA_ID=CAMNT_0000871811 /DNA_START=39 /DNA_END=3215 /DNA_ORIENTATION=- /assembly_acc=CAM_ASM_000599
MSANGKKDERGEGGEGEGGEDKVKNEKSASREEEEMLARSVDEVEIEGGNEREGNEEEEEMSEFPIRASTSTERGAELDGAKRIREIYDSYGREEEKDAAMRAEVAEILRYFSSVSSPSPSPSPLSPLPSSPSSSQAGREEGRKEGGEKEEGEEEKERRGTAAASDVHSFAFDTPYPVLRSPERGMAWCIATGALDSKRFHSGEYDLHKGGKHAKEECVIQIEKDIDRTATDEWIRTEEGKNALRRVLLAYASLRPSVGYVQSMNFIAGTCLVCCKSEEDAFWLFVHIVENVLADYFIPGLFGFKVDMRSLHLLVQKCLPDVAAKLDELMIELEAFCAGWFMTLFSNTMEGDALYRVWDIILAEQDGEGEMEGAQSGVVLFRFAVLLFVFGQEALLNASDPGSFLCALKQLHEIPTATTGSSLARILSPTLSLPFSTEHDSIQLHIRVDLALVSQCRERCRQRVEEELARIHKIRVELQREAKDEAMMWVSTAQAMRSLAARLRFFDNAELVVCHTNFGEISKHVQGLEAAIGNQMSAFTHSDGDVSDESGRQSICDISACDVRGSATPGGSYLPTDAPLVYEDEWMLAWMWESVSKVEESLPYSHTIAGRYGAARGLGKGSDANAKHVLSLCRDFKRMLCCCIRSAPTVAHASMVKAALCSNKREQRLKKKEEEMYVIEKEKRGEGTGGGGGGERERWRRESTYTDTLYPIESDLYLIVQGGGYDDVRRALVENRVRESQRAQKRGMFKLDFRNGGNSPLHRADSGSGREGGVMRSRQSSSGEVAQVEDEDEWEYYIQPFLTLFQLQTNNLRFGFPVCFGTLEASLLYSAHAELIEWLRERIVVHCSTADLEAIAGTALAVWSTNPWQLLQKKEGDEHMNILKSLDLQERLIIHNINIFSRLYCQPFLSSDLTCTSVVDALSSDREKREKEGRARGGEGGHGSGRGGWGESSMVIAYRKYLEDAMSHLKSMLSRVKAKRRNESVSEIMVKLEEIKQYCMEADKHETRVLYAIRDRIDNLKPGIASLDKKWKQRMTDISEDFERKVLGVILKRQGRLK